MGNFWRLLSGKRTATSVELAAEIVALERQLPDLQRQVQETHAQALRVAQKRLSGAKLTDGDTEVLGQHDDARLNREAAQAAVEELRAKLAEALERERDVRRVEIDGEIAALEKQRQAEIAEAILAAARLAVARHRIMVPRNAGEWLRVYDVASMVPGHHDCFERRKHPPGYQERIRELVDSDDPGEEPLDRRIKKAKGCRRQLDEHPAEALAEAALADVRGEESNERWGDG